jgi:hypothetical protein
MSESRFKVFLSPDPAKTRIELNGTLIGGVTKFAVMIDTETNRPVVTMTMLPTSLEGDIISKSDLLTEEQQAQIRDLVGKTLNTEGVKVNINQQRLNARMNADKKFTYDGTSTHISIEAIDTRKKTP